MPSRYIILTVGCPSTCESLPIHSSVARLAVMNKYWDEYEAFDRISHYRAFVSNAPVFNLLQSFLARTCYNPRVDVDFKWERVGDYVPRDLIDCVIQGLAHDDDIIQQWFGGDEVIKLLESAHSFDEMLLAVGAITGEHEISAEVLSYVERILGKY